jgi:hypothetical protein
MMTILSKWKFYASGHPLSGLSKKSSGIEVANISQETSTGTEA